MKFDKNDTAVVMIDPQNEVLSETGLGWPLLRESLHENNTVENMERIFKAAKEFGFEIFISPHYFYPTDKGWTSLPTPLCAIPSSRIRPTPKVSSTFSPPPLCK